MKTIKLNEEARAIVNQLCELMLHMNNRGDEHADGRSTYGKLSASITEFVRVETGLDISNPPTRYGWNLGGNRSYADDIQCVIDEIIDAKREEAKRTLEDMMEDIDGEPTQEELRSILMDLHKARREFTEDEISETEHQARLDAVFLLMNGPSGPVKLTTDEEITSEQFERYLDDLVPCSRFQSSGKEWFCLEMDQDGSPRRVIHFYKPIFG